MSADSGDLPTDRRILSDPGHHPDATRPLGGFAEMEFREKPRVTGHYEAQVAENAFDVGAALGRKLDEEHEGGYEIEQLLVCISYRRADGEVVAHQPLHGARVTSAVGLIEGVLRKLRAALD